MSWRTTRWCIAQSLMSSRHRNGNSGCICAPTTCLLKRFGQLVLLQRIASSKPFMFPLRLLRHLDLAQQVLDLLTYCGEGLQTYTQQTGFVAIAIPDLPLPEDAAAWGIDTALNIARRAEQALSDVPARTA
jgi:hypothetical protein